MQIRGVAHPPPPRNGRRVDPSDLTRAEIATTDIGGRPLLYEHEHGTRVGTCLASWEGRNGELRIAAKVDDPKTQQQIRSGQLRGLSLGTDMVQTGEGDVVFKRQAELSVCEEGRRPHTWIDTVDNRVVQVAACASNRRPGVCVCVCARPRAPVRAHNPLHPAIGQARASGSR